MNADSFFATNNKDGWADKPAKGAQLEIVGHRLKTHIDDLYWICAVCVDRYAKAYNPRQVNLEEDLSIEECGWCRKNRMCARSNQVGDLASGSPDSIAMPEQHDYHEKPLQFA